MAARERRDLTVLTLGGPGQPSRRYRFNRRALIVLLLALPCVAFAVGYVLGSRNAARTAAGASAGEPGDAPPAMAAQAAAPDQFAQPPTEPTAVPAAVPSDGIAPPTAEAQPLAAAAPPSAAAPNAPPAAAAAPAAAIAQAGATLQLLHDGSQQVVELQPFAADGTPDPGAFAQLESELACGNGHRVKPAPALVRVLLALQREFDKPLVLIGGRCAAHEDHPDAVRQHWSGLAADVRLRGVSSEQLMASLLERGVGGAGRYKRAGYVHVDVREGAREQWEAQEAAPEKAKPKPEPEAAAASDQAQAAPTAVAADPAAPAPAAPAIAVPAAEPAAAAGPATE